MTLKSLILTAFVSLFAVPQIASADDICFRSTREYSAVKKQLPRMLQSLPLMLGVDSSILAAIRISTAGDALYVEGYSSSAGVGSYQKQKVLIACVNGLELRAQFDGDTSGQVFGFTINGDTILFQGFELRKVSTAQYNALVKRVTDQMGGN